jgi:Tol biopolymer transport system component
VFVFDRLRGSCERVSVASGGEQGNGRSVGGWLSGDGRFVAFAGRASNLVPGDTNGREDVLVRDRLAGTTERVSVSSDGTQGNKDSYDPASISADGRFVAFTSSASNLVPGDSNRRIDVFVRDRLAGTTERVSVDSSGSQANDSSFFPSLSADGRFVVFTSRASNLVAGDANGGVDIFLHDRLTGTTELVRPEGAPGLDTRFENVAAIDADARVIAFDSEASDLVTGDTNGTSDIFVHAWAQVP